MFEFWWFNFYGFVHSFWFFVFLFVVALYPFDCACIFLDLQWVLRVCLLWCLQQPEIQSHYKEMMVAIVMKGSWKRWFGIAFIRLEILCLFFYHLWVVAVVCAFLVAFGSRKVAVVVTPFRLERSASRGWTCAKLCFFFLFWLLNCSGPLIFCPTHTTSSWNFFLGFRVFSWYPCNNVAISWFRSGCQIVSRRPSSSGFDRYCIKKEKQKKKGKKERKTS